MKRPLFLIWIGLLSGEAVSWISGWKGLVCPALLFLTVGVFYFIKEEQWSRFSITILIFACTMLGGSLLVFSERCEDGLKVRLEETEKDMSQEKTGEDRLSEESQSLRGEISGEIMSLSFQQSENYQIKLKNVTVRIGQKDYKIKSQVKVNGISEEEILAPGDEILCEGTVSLFSSPTNPGEFDSPKYYASQGIFYQFFAENVKVTKKGRWSLKQSAWKLRCQIGAVYEALLSEEEQGLVKAVVLGDKSDLSQELRTLYEENGVSHLLAISGLHISIVAGYSFRFFRKRGHGYFMSCLASAGLLFFYGCVTGFGSSVSRATLMFFFFLGAELLGARYDLVSAMSLSGILMLLEHPLWFLEGGFQISFLSIVAIGMVLPYMTELRAKRRHRASALRENQNRENEQKTKEVRIDFGAGGGLFRVIASKLSDMVFASLVISAVTAPVLMQIYYEWSPYSILLNIFLIPGMTPFMLSAMAGGVAGLFSLPVAFVILLPARLLFGISYGILCGTRTLPGAFLVTGCPGIVKVLLMYLIEGLIVWIWYQKRRWEGLLLVLSLVAVFLLKDRSSLQLHMLDVGQGECIVVEFPDGKTMLVDGGSTSRKKVGRYVIVPALKYYGIGKLDYVCLTHMDQDHISGVEELMEAHFKIDKVIVSANAQSLADQEDDAYYRIVQEAEQNKSEVYSFARGDCIRQGRATALCLHPFDGFLVEDRNDSSVVLYLKYGDFDALLTGDVGEAGELPLMDYLQKNASLYKDLVGQLDVLKVAHHGSKYSTAEALLQLLRPKQAIISAGRRNRYGHPHEELLERLKSCGSSIYGTQEGGAITIKTNGKTMKIETFLNEK